jgi:hypothetical protein
MNNTKTRTLAIVAVLMATTLVVGTFATVAATQPAFAVPPKKPEHDDKKDNKARDSGNGNGNTITALKCQNKGSASGFDTAVDQECENLICTHPGENATCTQEGAAVAPTTTPVKLTCEQCFTKFLSKIQLASLGSGLLIGLPELCAKLDSGAFSLAELTKALNSVEQATGEPIDQAGLIQCLRDAGIHLSTA